LITSARIGFQAGGRLIIQHHVRVQRDGPGQWPRVCASRRKAPPASGSACRQRPDHRQLAGDPVADVAFLEPVCSRRGKADVYRTRSANSNSAPPWNRNPICRRISSISCLGCMCPRAAGSSKLAGIRQHQSDDVLSSTDFAGARGPMMTTDSRSRTLTFRPVKTFTGPKLL